VLIFTLKIYFLKCESTKPLKNYSDNGLVLATYLLKRLKTTGHNRQLLVPWKRKPSSLEWFSVYNNHSVAIQIL